eukprot:8772078-Pyramimonas_sp.AAC.1
MREMFLTKRWHAGWYCMQGMPDPPMGHGPVSSETGTRQVRPWRIPWRRSQTSRRTAGHPRLVVR